MNNIKLIKTLKEYYNKQVFKEGIHDPNIFKCFFVVGGPGSGKGYIVDKAFGGVGQAHGLKYLNQDDLFEFYMNKKLQDTGKEKYDLAKLYLYGRDKDVINVRQHTKRKTLSKPAELALQDLFNPGVAGDTNRSKMYYAFLQRLGIIIDGTGKNDKSILEIKNFLEKFGYECFMIAVNTDLEVSIKRNEKRARRVPEEVVTSSWHNFQKNIKLYEEKFGHDNFLEFDNTEFRSSDDPAFRVLSSFVNKCLRKPLKPEALKWIEMEKIARGIEK